MSSPKRGADLVAPIREGSVAVRPTTEGGEAHGKERPMSVPTSVEMPAAIDVPAYIKMLAAMDVLAALEMPVVADGLVTSEMPDMVGVPVTPMEAEAKTIGKV